ncbi:MAG: hypothetical protein KatS3mg009_0379 [Acidimicrobiia bacterium]|nr:MAG: hypothetical protein KatS3mg009_0379 [Acidimicrobiia bacterium]
MPGSEPMVVGAFTRLRMAVAVAHSVPGLSLEVRFGDGTGIRAGAHGGTATELGICELRGMILAGHCPPWPVLAERVTALRLDGPGVVDHGGGLYGRAVPGRPGGRECWFATVLAPATVRDLLAGCPVADAEHVDANLRVDGGLGVVTVVCRAGPDLGAGRLLETARWASAACYTRELLYAAAHHPVD